MIRVDKMLDQLMSDLDIRLDKVRLAETRNSLWVVAQALREMADGIDDALFMAERKAEGDEEEKIDTTKPDDLPGVQDDQHTISDKDTDPLVP